MNRIPERGPNPDEYGSDRTEMLMRLLCGCGVCGRRIVRTFGDEAVVPRRGTSAVIRDGRMDDVVCRECADEMAEQYSE